MKKFMYPLALAVLVLASCSSSDDNKSTSDGFATTPASGVVYSHSFTAAGGTASTVTANGVVDLYIHLTSSVVDCDTDIDSPIWIIVPKAVGSYTFATGGYIQFQDDANGSFGGSSDIKLEINAITATSVKGRIKATGDNPAENSLNGTFDVVYCP